MNKNHQAPLVVAHAATVVWSRASWNTKTYGHSDRPPGRHRAPPATPHTPLDQSRKHHEEDRERCVRESAGDARLFTHLVPGQRTFPSTKNGNSCPRVSVPPTMDWPGLDLLLVLPLLRRCPSHATSGLADWPFACLVSPPDNDSSIRTASAAAAVVIGFFLASGCASRTAATRRIKTLRTGTIP